MIKSDKFILTIFLIIIFGVFICYPIRLTREILNLEVKNDDGTWKTYDEDTSLINRIKINIENRVTNYFPGYKSIAEVFKNTNELVNEKIYGVFDSNYIPAGTNSDGEYLVKDTANNAYYAFSDISTEKLEEKLDKQIEFFNNMYKSNPQVNFYIYLPNRLELQENINDFSKYRDLSIYVEKFKNGLDEKIKIQELKVNTIEEYNNYFYKSDHHWNMYGAYKGYQDIMTMMGHSNIQNIKITEEDIKFKGSFSRTTRNNKIYDKFYTVDNYNKNYTVTVNNETPKDNFQPLSLEILNKKKLEFYDWYVGYFNGLYGNVVYDFANENKKNLLIISDSYAWSIDFLIANNYNKTHVINVMYDEYLKNPLNYTQYIKENDIDDVLILQEGVTTIFDSFDHNFEEKVVW